MPVVGWVVPRVGGGVWWAVGGGVVATVGGVGLGEYLFLHTSWHVIKVLFPFWIS